MRTDFYMGALNMTDLELFISLFGNDFSNTGEL